MNDERIIRRRSGPSLRRGLADETVREIEGFVTDTLEVVGDALELNARSVLSAASVGRNLEFMTDREDLESDAGFSSDVLESELGGEQPTREEPIAEKEHPCGCHDAAGAEVARVPDEWGTGDPEWMVPGEPCGLPLQPWVDPAPGSPSLPLGDPIPPSESSWDQYPEVGFPAEEICWRAPRKPCRGFYVAYPKDEPNLVRDLLAVLAQCGLAAQLTDRPQDRCGQRECCRNPKGNLVIQRVDLQPNVAVPGPMARIAHMIRGTLAENSAFCLELNGTIRAIDWYRKRENGVESQFNPTWLLGTPAADYHGYRRTQCDLLAHVIGENFWGNNCYTNYLGYEEAHKLALVEENWIRQQENPKRPPMTWPDGTTGLPSATESEAGLKNFDKQVGSADTRQKKLEEKAAKEAKAEKAKKVF